MSSRTAHSFGGMRRYIQQSRTQTFIFVEGRDLDPQVYGAICGPVCKESGKSYEIVVADRMNGAGGGKGILTHFFEYLRDNNCLVDHSQPEAKLSMFYLDKDADDLLKMLRPSAHVIYTVQHSIENHLFIEGDLALSLAIAGSVDLQVIQSRIPDAALWRSMSAGCWREWVALCILARKLSLSHPATYAKPSSLNTPVDSATDPVALAVCVTEMEARSGLAHEDFESKLAAAHRLVDAINSRGGHDLLFKGKWYTHFALRELEITYPFYNKNGAPDRLMGSLIASTNFNGRWVQRFQQPLRDALAAL
jgi:hypothetical protein